MPDSLNGLSESTIRLICSAGVFAVIAVLELAAPRRALLFGRTGRWFTNLAIVAIDTAVLRIVFPVLAVGVAVWANEHGWGVLHLIDLPAWLAILIAVLLLDLAIYGQHVASHVVPVLWRVHRMHHADRDFDVTTALRFHPIEICLSMLWKFLVVIALGADPLAVVIFEIVLNATAMFNHGNFRLPLPFDRLVRLIIVTPDMHRVHHSVVARETNSNYGFNLSVWDRLFRTYIPQPAAGHDEMTIGLPQFQDAAPTRLVWNLTVPFTTNGQDREDAS